MNRDRIVSVRACISACISYAFSFIIKLIKQMIHTVLRLTQDSLFLEGGLSIVCQPSAASLAGIKLIVIQYIFCRRWMRLIASMCCSCGLFISATIKWLRANAQHYSLFTSAVSGNRQRTCFLRVENVGIKLFSVQVGRWYCVGVISPSDHQPFEVRTLIYAFQLV